MTVEWLPLDEAADRLGWSRSALHRAVKKGEVRSTRRGRRLLVAVDDGGGMESGTIPGPSRDGTRDGGMPRVPRDAATARLAAKREALLELELERTRMELEDERARREATRVEAARKAAHDRALYLARVLLDRAPRSLPESVLQKFGADLGLLVELGEPESVTAEAVARLLVDAARGETLPIVEPARPAALDPMLWLLLASGFASRR